MSNILEVKDLNVSYGGIKAVKNISFQVPKGEVVTLIGANGAGKSSTLRSIVGLVKPASGSILLDGEEIAGKAPEQIVSKGITLVPEGRRVFADLTVLENLKIGAYMRKDSLEDDLNWCYDIREINRQGKTILLVEQNANMALHAANHGYVMETGRITLSGTGEELAANESVKAAYLGKQRKN